jgi:hypothetical protein
MMVNLTSHKPVLFAQGKAKPPAFTGGSKTRFENSTDKVQFAGSSAVRRAPLLAVAAASLAAVLSACTNTSADKPEAKATASCEAPARNGGIVFRHLQDEKKALIPGKFDTKLLQKFYASLPQDGHCNRPTFHEQQLLSGDGKKIKAGFEFYPAEDKTISRVSIRDVKNRMYYDIFPDSSFKVNHTWIERTQDWGDGKHPVIDMDPDLKTEDGEAFDQAVQRAQTLMREFLAEQAKGSKRISDVPACDFSPTCGA